MSAKASNTSKEKKRLKVLESYNVLEADLQDELDGLTSLAASLYQAPISMVNLLDNRYQVIKSAKGVAAGSIPRENGFCQYTVKHEGPFLVEDTTADEHFSKLPFLQEHPHIQFYAGVPLKNRDGHVLGALCILDYKRRTFAKQDFKHLQLLAEEVMSRMELYRNKRQLEQQNQSLKRAAQLLKNSSDIQAKIDAKTLKVEYLNKEANQWLGGRKEDHLGDLFGKSIIDEDIRKTVRDFLTSSSKKRKQITASVRNKAGDVRHLAFTFTRNGQYWYMTARDETQKQTYQRELQKRSQALESSMDGIAILDANDLFTYVNQAHVWKYGYENPDELLGQHWNILYERETINEFEQEIFPHLDEHGNWRGESIGLRKDGSQFPQELSLSRLEGGGLVCIVRDITSRKQQEEQLQSTLDRLERAQHIANMASWEWSIENNKMIWSKGSYDIMGFENNPENPTIEDYLKIVYSKDVERVQNVLKDVRSGKKPQSMRHRIITPDGTIKHIEIRAERYIEEAGAHVRVIGSTQDITEQVTAEQQLRNSLQEKEILLAEIHHRVKNNLAIISSLLQLESFQAENTIVQDILTKSQMRIQSMAAIHEKLYKEGDFNNIPFDEYVRDMLQSIRDTFGTNPENIAIKLALDDVSLNVNQALPCGLILNEMVVNAFKHAFEDRREGEIVIRLDEEDGPIRLSVTDNGVGLSRDFDNDAGDSLGFTLIKTLIKQLQATLTVESSAGTKFVIEFTKSDKKGSSSAFSLN